MTNINTPKDGDFASLLEKASAQPSAAIKLQEEEHAFEGIVDADAALEKLEEIAGVEHVPLVDEKELERQALADGGADNDTSTPE